MFRSIRLKLSCFLFVLLSFIIFAFFLTTIKILNQTIREEIIKRAETLNKSSAAAAAYCLISDDSLGIDHIVFKGKSSSSDIEYIAIVDKKMKILAHSDIRKIGEVRKDEEGTIIKKIGDGTPQEVANSKTVIEVYLGEASDAGN